MENQQPSFAQRTKQLKDIAFQLKNAADVALAEVQHMEAAQERFAQKAKAKHQAPRLTAQPFPGRGSLFAHTFMYGN